MAENKPVEIELEHKPISERQRSAWIKFWNEVIAEVKQEQTQSGKVG